ncbi:MAG TPA: hypothetical protein VJY33_01935 [Isosphaeraceae bacterium]|nr:hypothetical protein [Isosphaeraceae bacterium]
MTQPRRKSPVADPGPLTLADASEPGKAASKPPEQSCGRRRGNWVYAEIDQAQAVKAMERVG